MFKKPKKQFERDQLVFIVTTMIAACIDNIVSTIPQRWMNGKYDENWKLELDDFHKCWDSDSFFQANLNQLGWNLSILFAQVIDDGMGVGDALSVRVKNSDLESILTDFYDRTLKGELGIVPSVDDPNSGHGQLPDCEELAEAWVEQTFFSPRNR